MCSNGGPSGVIQGLVPYKLHGTPVLLTRHDKNHSKHLYKPVTVDLGGTGHLD